LFNIKARKQQNMAGGEGAAQSRRRRPSGHTVHMQRAYMPTACCSTLRHVKNKTRPKEKEGRTKRRSVNQAENDTDKDNGLERD
jgi:hypothetical protein